MCIRDRYLEREIAQRRLRSWFSGYGISSDRLVFEGRSFAAEYLDRYNDIDIALDPFPYNGGTTTLDTLWMGVPLVSISGRLAVACSGASSLSAIGLPVAQSVEEYIAIASNLVKTIPTTPGIRCQIRESMLKSPLMDEIGLVRALEVAYREMWQTWCASVRC